MAKFSYDKDNTILSFSKRNLNDDDFKKAAQEVKDFPENIKTVTTLDVQKNELTGYSIDHIIGLLKIYKNINKINLNFNKFDDISIMDLIWYISESHRNMQEIFLANNNFGPYFAAQFNGLLKRKEICLTSLDLSYNELDDESAIDIIKHLATHKLRFLSIGNKNMKDKSLDEIIKLIENPAVPLATLDLSGMNLQGNLDRVANAVLKSKHLNNLYLRGTNVTEEEVTSMLEKPLSLLTSLDFRDNNLSKQLMQKVKDQVSKNRDGSVIYDFRQRQILISTDGRGFDFIMESEEFEIAVKGNVLCLNGLNNKSNKIEKIKAINSIIIAVKSNKHITCLDLSNNVIGDEQTSHFFNSLPYPDNMLKSLKLNNNAITLAGKSERKKFMEFLAHQSELEVLAIAKNNLEHAAIMGLATMIKDEAFMLKNLDLSETGMTKGEAIAIADALKDKNCKLQKLSIAGNKIAVKGLEAIGNALPKNVTLTDLDISNIGVNDKSALVEFLKKLKNSKITHFSMKLDERIILNKKDSQIVLDIIKSNPYWVEFDIRNIDLHTSIINEMKEFIQSRKSLRKLLFSFNDIKNTDDKTFLDVLKTIPNFNVTTSPPVQTADNSAKSDVDINELRQRASEAGTVLDSLQKEIVILTCGKLAKTQIITYSIEKMVGIVTSGREKIIIKGVNLNDYMKHLEAMLEVDTLKLIDISECEISEDNFRKFVREFIKLLPENDVTCIIPPHELLQNLLKIYNEELMAFEIEKLAKVQFDAIMEKIKEKNEKTLDITSSIYSESDIAKIAELLKYDESVKKISFNFDQNHLLAKIWIPKLAEIMENNLRITEIFFEKDEIKQDENTQKIIDALHVNEAMDVTLKKLFDETKHLRDWKISASIDEELILLRGVLSMYDQAKTVVEKATVELPDNLLQNCTKSLLAEQTKLLRTLLGRLHNHL